MKAVVCTKYGPPEVLQIREIKKPTPKNNEIRIKIHATSVTTSDCIIRGFKVNAKYRILMRLAVGFRKPRKSVLGMVYAGEVESVGEDVKTFIKGEKVLGFDRYDFGTYAEYKCISENSLVVKLAQSISYEHAAAVPYGGLLALYYMKKGNVQDGQKVLIYGASGAVGTSAVQLAKFFGAEVTGVCSTANINLVKSLGADKVLDYTSDNFSLDGEQYNLIFNAVGKRKAKLRLENALTKNGKHITVDDGSPKLHISDLKFLNELIGKGQIKAVIDRIVSLDEIVDAHRYVDKGHKKGNVIIVINHKQ